MNSVSLQILLLKIRKLVYLQLSSIIDYFLFKINIKVGVPVFNTDEKLIVYLGEFLPPRIPRMAKWVKKKQNYTLVLLCHSSGYFKEFSNGCFDKVFLFRNEWHMKRILQSLPKIDLMHGFAPKSHYGNVARKFINCPYIHDMQDVYAIYYDIIPDLDWLKKELPEEKECLEKAEGIIAHSMEINAAYRKYGIKNKPPALFFPLYCDDDNFQFVKKNFDPDNIHLVYAGAVGGAHRNPSQYGNIQFHSLIKELSDQKIHFHIYPSPSGVKIELEEYEKIAEINPYFHFHQAVSQSELSKELSKYDFGLLPFFKEFSEQSFIKLKYATTLKLFNYLEAGLPIFVSKDLIFQNWIIDRYNYGYSISSYSELAKKIRKISESDYKLLQNNLLNSREKLSLMENIPHLINFYSKLLAEKYQNK